MRAREHQQSRLGTSSPSRSSAGAMRSEIVFRPAPTDLNPRLRLNPRQRLSASAVEPVRESLHGLSEPSTCRNIDRLQARRCRDDRPATSERSSSTRHCFRQRALQRHTPQCSTGSGTVLMGKAGPP